MRASPSEGKDDNVVFTPSRSHHLATGCIALLLFYLNYFIQDYSCVFISDIWNREQSGFIYSDSHSVFNIRVLCSSPQDVLNIPGSGPSVPSLCSLGCLHAFNMSTWIQKLSLTRWLGNSAWHAHIGTFKYNLISRPYDLDTKER